MAAHRARALLHGFEQRSLSLWRGAINFVGQHKIAEDRAMHERPFTTARDLVLFNDVRAGDVRRHQVGRELDAAKLQAQRIRNGAHHQRFRGAGHAGQQHVTADEQRDQHLVHHLVLADDHLAHLAHNVFAHGMKALDASL